MPKPKKQKTRLKLKKINKIKPAKRRKVLVRKKVNKVRKTLLRIKLRKGKVKKIIRTKKKIILKPKKKIVLKKIAKKPARKKVIKPKKTISKKAKKTIKPRIKPIKHNKARIPAKPKLFNRVKKVISHKVKKHIVKKSKEHLTEGFPAETLFKAKIKVIGIGGGGGSIVSEIGRSLEKATFVIADTDIRALKKKSGMKYFWFGEELTHGLGTGVNVDLAKKAAESAKEKISSFFKDQDIIIFVASLGGGLGSGATQIFAETAREFGGITFGIFTTPFKFEGKNKQRIAQNALKSLRQSLNVSLVIPNEKIFKVIDSSTPITNAFSIVNKSLIESLESLIDLIYNPGVINIDFADLRTILKGRGNSAFLNTIEESGKDKVEKICEKIFKNPLLQNNSFKAEKILFNIAGSDNLSMFHVEKISSHISNLNPKARIIFGISKDNKLKNKIKTTILMTGGQTKEDEAVKEKELIKAVVVEKIKEGPKATPKKEAVIIKKELKIKVKKAKSPKKIKSKKPFGKAKGKKKEKTAVPIKQPDKKNLPAQAGEKQVSFIPVFEVPVSSIPVVEQNKMNITEITQASNKKTIRRSGLEIKKAEELQEKKRIAQEKEWEIPAFLRKVKFKN